MSPKRIVPFKISGMDSLGQGVSKVTDKVTFIPKTAVGDEGLAEILEEKKSVAFARVTEFHQRSDLRKEPECPHFSQCPSCHFQHLSYETELGHKRETLERLFRHHKLPSLEVIEAPHRLGYRNRIQLHYDLGQRKLGMLSSNGREIIPVPECLLGLPQVKSELERLYANNQWMSEAPMDKSRGHVEVYWHEERLKVTWNGTYASGGFTQVFEQMNQRLKHRLEKWASEGPSVDLLDLFAGNGNLSGNLNHSRRLCVDIYPSRLPGEEYFSQDLYDKRALRNVISELKKRNLRPKTLLLDPPRSGLKNLKEWIEALSPERLAYVSCDPHTLVRDLSGLTGFEISEALLLDFFPSTFHFETMVFLRNIN